MNYRFNYENNFIDTTEHFSDENSVIINVGSGGPEKIINLDFDVSKYIISNKPYNKQEPNWSDKFDVKILEKKKILVKRVDRNSSWGQQLLLIAKKKQLTAEEMMYKSDLKNIESNKSIDDVNDNKIINLIKNKLNHIENNHRNDFKNNIEIYKQKKNLLQELHNNNHKSKLILDKQNKEKKFNGKKIKSNKNDIITLRRQIEISQNQTIRRNNKLFILKTIFVYFLILIIPILLIKNKNISNRNGIISVSLITLIFLGSILLNFYRNRNINNLNYDVRDWNEPSIKTLSEANE